MRWFLVSDNSFLVKSIFKTSIFLTFALLIIVHPSDGQGAVRRNKVDTKNIYLLKTRSESRKKLVCYLSGTKIKIGISPKTAAGSVSFLPYKPAARYKKLLQAAIKECRKKVLSPACSDGCDNDGDGLRDYPKDLQCTSSTDTAEQDQPAACSDGIDNDNDGKIDYPNDDGCSSVADPNETNANINPDFPGSQCNDGLDNDQDGQIDFGQDVGCKSFGDNDEAGMQSPVNQFSVFRKPFDGRYSIGSMFDHRYALQFIHSDGSTLTYTNEETMIGVDGHEGYDYLMDEGTPVLAAYDGTVVFAGNETPFYCPPLNSTVSGIAVRIRHEINGEVFDSVYAHFSSLAVINGQSVAKGALLGLSGNTGCSTGPHLHFDIQRRTNTNDGLPASIDPSGWLGLGTDPWETHVNGTQSFRLWASGEEPEEFRFVSSPPNPNTGDNAPVAITYFRWAGSSDSTDANNEYVELSIDPRYYSGQSLLLEGYKLKNNLNEEFNFPAGFRIKQGQPVRIYSGAGINSTTEIYWNRFNGAWSNSGDCARLLRPEGSAVYTFRYGDIACSSSAIIKSFSLPVNVVAEAVNLRER